MRLEIPAPDAGSCIRLLRARMRMILSKNMIIYDRIHVPSRSTVAECPARICRPQEPGRRWKEVVSICLRWMQSLCRCGPAIVSIKRSPSLVLQHFCSAQSISNNKIDYAFDNSFARRACGIRISTIDGFDYPHTAKHTQHRLDCNPDQPIATSWHLNYIDIDQPIAVERRTVHLHPDESILDVNGYPNELR